MAVDTDRLKVVILAAGVGSRLGFAVPKPLIPLATGVSIIEQQLDNLSHYVDREDVMLVVGYKKEFIMEAFPRNVFVYNERYSVTNTSKSLVRGLARCRGHDVLWLNGDVVFDHEIVRELLGSPDSAVAVVSSQVGEEEVKYRTDSDGAICEISKHVADAEGEAVGINLVRSRDLAMLVQCLELCDKHDYFERAVELAIGESMTVRAVDVSAYRCIEVDFPEDLRRANELFGGAQAIADSDRAAGPARRASVA